MKTLIKYILITLAMNPSLAFSKLKDRDAKTSPQPKHLFECKSSDGLVSGELLAIHEFEAKPIFISELIKSRVDEVRSGSYVKIDVNKSDVLRTPITEEDGMIFLSFYEENDGVTCKLVKYAWQLN